MMPVVYITTGRQEEDIGKKRSQLEFDKNDEIDGLSVCQCIQLDIAEYGQKIASYFLGQYIK